MEDHFDEIGVSDKLNVLVRERDKMRDELLSKQTSMRTMTLALLTLGMGSATAYLGNHSLFMDSESRFAFLITSSQIAIFIGGLIVAYWSSLRMHAAYVSALELRINILAGEDLSLWECFAVKEFFFSSPVTYATLPAILISSAIVVVVVNVGIGTSEQQWPSLLIVGELVALAVAVLSAQQTASRMEEKITGRWAKPSAK